MLGWLTSIEILSYGYQPGYMKIEFLRLLIMGCWSHARRKFVEALSLLPALER